MAGETGALRIGKHLRPARGVARLPGVGDECGHLWRRVAAGASVTQLRPRARRLAFELGKEPVEAVEVVAKPFLGVVVGVAEDADRTAVAAVDDRSQQLEVERPLAQRQDLPADPCRRPCPCR